MYYHYLLQKLTLTPRQPKYWCKHCKLFVKDTPLEKKNHESTPRHQGNLKRFLRDLHRSHENEARDKERAKQEVARLQGLTSAGGPGGVENTSSAFGDGPNIRVPKAQATAQELKKQAAQLLELGIGVPDEFRGELAVPGEWQVMNQRVIEPEGVNMDSKSVTARAIGVKKREVEVDEEEEIEKKKVKRGSRYRAYPGQEGEDQDLDALLSQATAPKPKVEPKEESREAFTSFKQERDATDAQDGVKQEMHDGVDIKPDPEQATKGQEPALTDVPLAAEAAAASVKPEEGVPGVVFKKRKSKNIRHR